MVYKYQRSNFRWIKDNKGWFRVIGWNVGSIIMKISLWLALISCYTLPPYSIREIYFKTTWAFAVNSAAAIIVGKQRDLGESMVFNRHNTRILMRKQAIPIWSGKLWLNLWLISLRAVTMDWNEIGLWSFSEFTAIKRFETWEIKLISRWNCNSQITVYVGINKDLKLFAHCMMNEKKTFWPNVNSWRK